MIVKKALIIAAGQGSRLKNGKKDPPKPLKKVAGLPLIVRIIKTAKIAGIHEFVIVVGYQKEKIIKELTKAELGVKIEFVENPEWEKPNGLSVLKASPYIHEDFVLLMSDHIFEAETLLNLRQQQLGSNRALLAIDTRIDSIFDLDDATKVLAEKNQIHQIGKKLTNYNAIDTGMFLASPELFDAIQAVHDKGEQVTLSAGIQLLASRKQMGTYDIGLAYWQDVDTQATLKQAEKYLVNACRKPTDGVISRNFNRYISLWVSRRLAKTNLSANHVTGLTFLVGVFSGVFAARGTYLSVVIGALLFQLSSILDGCDGEISKLKMSSSHFGQWFDTICDNLTYLIFIIGIVLGFAKTGHPHILVTGSLVLFGLVMTVLVMFLYLLRNTNSGSLNAVQNDFKKIAKDSKTKTFFSKIQFVLKRDFFAILFFILSVFLGLKSIFWLCLIGSNIAWIVILYITFVLIKPQGVVVKESAKGSSL